MRRADLKANLKNIPERDRCMTPPYAIEPLLPYIPKHKIIWEPAVGEGYLADEFIRQGYECVGTDIIYSDEHDNQDFLTCEVPPCDVIVTNPPYSIKQAWLERCYEIGLAFALLLPTDTIGNQSAQNLFKKYGIEIMVLNRRVDFKMPNKGWDSAAFFSTAWYCWNILPEQIVYGEINKRPPNQPTLMVP